MVALSVAFYARLSVGSRQIVEIFNILNEFMGNVFGKVPAYTTIGYWTQELGLSVYKESCWRKRSIPTHSGWLYPLTFDAEKGLKEA